MERICFNNEKKSHPQFRMTVEEYGTDNEESRRIKEMLVKYRYQVKLAPHLYTYIYEKVTL